MWMVRCDGGQLAETFLEQGMVSIGWAEASSLLGLTREQVIEKVKQTYPEYKPMKAVNSGSQLFKIASGIKTGDRVMTYDRSKRVYHIGRVTGDYTFDANAQDATAHRRKVSWDAQIERDKLSVPTKNSLGSTLSIFEISEGAEKEIDALLSGKPVKIEQPEAYASAEVASDTKDLLEELKSKAREFIKDRLIALDWDEMQELVAGALRAMGYKTRVSAPGADRGKDIVASPDGLGLEQPRIVVEVKHRPNNQMGSQEIRSFLGGRHKDDKGLYVSTGGFSKDAKYEADRASIPLTLMDIDDLVELVIENYENMDMETRSLLPLVKIYWPS
ncbi:MAG: restriction endonuclease [Azospirillum brasilense]|nr:MAG: restriction endonuclease [Azospirillum brasilense]